MEPYINEYGKPCWRGVTLDTPFSHELFHVVENTHSDDIQWAFHSNLGSITVLDRETGYSSCDWAEIPCRDRETGYRSPEGKFWLASGMFDIRWEHPETLREAIERIVKNANTCIGD